MMGPVPKPIIALAYIDIDVVDKPEQQQADNSNATDTIVDSEIDWSDFYTHDGRDLFTATVNSLKRSYDLSSIDE